MAVLNNLIVNGASRFNNNITTSSLTLSGGSSATGITGNSRIFYGTCSTAAGTVQKDVVCPNFTSTDLVIGTIIFVTFTQTNSAEVANITMSVNGTTAKNIKKQYNTTGPNNLTAAAELYANNTYMFQYNGTYWVCMTLDYNSTYNQGNNCSTYERNYVHPGSTLYRYRICGYDKYGKIVPLTNNPESTSGIKTGTTVPIDVQRGLVYYNNSSTTGIASNGVIGAKTLYSSICITTPHYTFSTGTIASYSDIFLQGSYNSTTGLFTLDTTSGTSWYVIASRATTSSSTDSSSWTTYKGAFTSGKYYMFVGPTYSANNYLQIKETNPVYYYDGTNLKPVWGVSSGGGVSMTGSGGSSTNYYLMGTPSTLGTTLYRYGTNGPYMNGVDLLAGSDINYKKDITPISGAFVDELFTRDDVTYDFKWKDTDKESSGFIAQWIEDIMPEMVNGVDGEKHVNYNAALSKVVGAMFKKIKEQQKEIDELKTIIKNREV